MANKEVISSKAGRKPHKEPKNIYTPTSVFKDTSLSVFESWVEYLKDKRNLSFKQIALLTNRNERNIWTVYNRAKKKRE